MKGLVEELLKDENYISLRNSLKTSKINNISTIGLTDSAKAMCVYTLSKELDKSSLIVCSNVYQANKIIEDLKFFSSDIEIIFLPSKQIKYYDIEAESKELSNQRMYAIEQIMNKKRNIIVTTIDTLLVNMQKVDTLKKKDLQINIAEEIDTEEFISNLTDFGYERAEIVEGKGQFAVRGGIIDIFPINKSLPHRIELFGNEIDNIRTFDSNTQRSIDTVKKLEITRASESYISNEKKEEVVKKLKQLLDRNDISSNLKLNISKDIEKIKNLKLENIFDKYFELFKGESTNLLDYLKDYNIFIDEPTRVIEKSQNIVYENEEILKNFEERDVIYTPYVNRYLTFEDVSKKLENKSTIYLEKLCIDKDIHKNRHVINIFTNEANFFRESMDVLIRDIKVNKEGCILLVFPSHNRVEQIKNYLLENNIQTKVINDLSEVDTNKHVVYIIFGMLSSGFVVSNKIAIIAESVSGTNLVKKRRRDKENSIGKKINGFDEIEEGDFLVHENHGIGIYRGIQTVKVDGHFNDYIKIEYAKGGAIYVPINQLDLVKKYVCDDDTVPKINTLGTKEWTLTKRKVTKHVQEVAKKLVLLYAKREKLEGFAYSKDTPWQKEFEDSFEYELTDDQKQSVEEIKKDMEESKPMDRLLCGDVGYGKTEVALRAAFKAVMSKKQVAYLVPTTVLCLQQYRTFKGRMEDFGVRVEMLSRFKTKKEQTQILKDLVDGKIDVIIGTHRLLSKDVFFSDLGLLIIDEEHRFGVKAKESIKILKESVDVLSMTATPIPRTLHMSMIGVRGMSTLTEPPIERLPVHTYVVEYDEDVIKNAIEKELARDGQVFYINNRVEGIEEITAKVRSMVPNAKVAFAHGQMDPKLIEDIMLSFMEHDIDVLVCTTILESGIDIPNANTIIIEDADKLGLAQLYQIRGRVGRSNRLAYAYITYKKDKQLSEVSLKRLRAIKDFTEFGSGFKIALRDLEIRGAGNILGKEQHGHMAKVGYDMYLAMLERAVKLEKEGIDNIDDVTNKDEVKIDLKISAYISDNYIKDPIQKIVMYQKISDIKTNDDTLDVVDELLDRYGTIPREVENLIKIVEIRNLAKKLKLTKIFQYENIVKVEPNKYKIYLTNKSNNDILVTVQNELKKMLDKEGENINE